MTAEPVSVPPQGGRSLWSTVREAMAGAEGKDFTEGPIRSALLLLAIPMVLEVALESVFAVVNVFWVNRLGASAVAIVGLTEAMLSTIYALGMGLGIGATAMVARRIGEKNPAEASRAAVQAILLGVMVSIPIAVLGAAFAPQLLALMGADPTIVEQGKGFTRIMFLGNASILLLFLINAIFRGAGDAAVAMRCLWIANLANLILDPVLIFGLGPFPEMGVEGAAVATTVGRGVGVLYQFYRLAGKDRRFVIERRHLIVDLPLMGKLIRLSTTGIFQILIGTTSWIGLVRIIATFGATAVAGYTIAIRVILFALLPSWGLSNAAATMVGQSLGAKKPERAEESVWRASFLNLCFLGGLALIFLVAAPWIVRIFTTDPEVSRHAVLALRIVSVGFPFYAYGMVISNAFNGAGDTTTPTLLNVVCFWLWEIPLAYVLAKPVGLGPTGAFIAITIAFSTLAVVSALLFRRGKWKSKAI
ncbi:MAG: MATE family efflux transporter [Gemmatimonadales bacterium]|nr:MATE family efflux transporter [Gemmatimonadales bacterium]